MRRMLSMLGASLLFGLATAGTAAAGDFGSGPLLGQSQTSGQSQTGSSSVTQDASSQATAISLAQLNVNAPVRVLSDGNDGSVDQSNDTSASSSASNKSVAIQGIGQEQSSRQGQAARQGSDCGCDGGGHADPQQSQSSKQSQEGSNAVDQDARSKAVSVSLVQANVNAPVRVLSDGSNGDVDQSNTTSASSSASNKSIASQWIGQEQGSLHQQDGRQAGCCGPGGHAARGDHGKGKGCGCDGGPVVDQDLRSKQKQSASNSVSQDAYSKAFALSLVQPNVNAPIRILSGEHTCGCKGGAGGDVHQSNATTAGSSASNRSWARQGIDQSQWEARRQFGLQRL